MNPLDEFRKVNLARCEAVYRNLYDWGPMQWAAALVGEAAELSNAATKFEQAAGHGVDVEPLRQNVLREVGDVYAYLDLLMARLGVDPNTMWLWICKKFNERSAALGVAHRTVEQFVARDPGDITWHSIQHVMTRVYEHARGSLAHAAPEREWAAYAQAWLDLHAALTLLRKVERDLQPFGWPWRAEERQ